MSGKAIQGLLSRFRWPSSISIVDRFLAVLDPALPALSSKVGPEQIQTSIPPLRGHMQARVCAAAVAPAASVGGMRVVEASLAAAMARLAAARTAAARRWRWEAASAATAGAGAAASAATARVDRCRRAPVLPGRQPKAGGPSFRTADPARIAPLESLGEQVVLTFETLPASRFPRPRPWPGMPDGNTASSGVNLRSRIKVQRASVRVGSSEFGVPVRRVDVQPQGNSLAGRPDHHAGHLHSRSRCTRRPLQRSEATEGTAQ